MKKLLFALMLALVAAPPAYCAGDVLQEVKSLVIMKDLFSPQIAVIEARDMGSLFEVVAQEPSKPKQIFYITKDGTYLFAGGNLINKDKVNLTQVRYDEITKVDLSKLPLQDALVIKRGTGAKKLITFFDVDCPYCRKAYDWLKTQNDYTLYVFLFPLDFHPKSAGKSVEVLCSKNQETALENALSEKEIGSEKCESGEKMLTKQKTVAAGVEVEGTPLFITDTGARINGLQTKALENYLKN